jgi:hypothetical protein
MASLITSLPSWVLFLLIFSAGILAAEGGALLKRRKEEKATKGELAPLNSLIGALLGLLAFMLGLTFSISASRFSERKQLLVDHANAIGTSYLRTNLLPDSQQVASKRIFNDYTDLLIRTSQSPNIEKNVSRLEALQLQLWNIAASLKEANMDPQLRVLYIASVNELLDVSGERKTVVFIFKIPGPIWAVLLLLFIFSMFVAGLEFSSFQVRRNLNVIITTAAFSMIVVLISAMDASYKPGQFTVNQQPLIDVQQMIKNDLLHKPN